MQISKNVDEAIIQINESNNVSDICSIFRENVFGFDPAYQQEWLSQFCNRESMIDPKSVESCAKAIYMEVYSFDDSQFFVMLNSKQLMISFLADLLLKFSEDRYNSFLEEIKCDYSKLNVIRSIIYWIKNNSNIPQEQREHYKNKIDAVHKKMCDSVMKDIDLYDDDNYHQKNIFGLFNDKDEKTEGEKEETIVDYISSVVSCQNIYRILGDTINSSMGHNYSYYISEKNLKLFFDNTQIIDDLIREKEPKTESENFVYRVYDNYRNGCRSSMDENVIVQNEEVKLFL
ncbi:MAG: hypothetical protein HFE30_01155 [Clostridiales bacterium]|nr:hypothetical protein [Clostridiales bacterium]